MPLCPQITNTPIPVTLTSDFTVTDVVPVVPANTEQLAAVELIAEDAQADATAAIAAAADAVAAADAAEAEATAAAADAAAATAAAAAAASAAGTAQSTANTALANAATAYTAAVGSLQPSASTIVNASNQMTAIASNGITVYSGASATTGARVVLNSLGLAGYNSGGTATFSISASTGAAVFSGSVTGSTITGGTLNIGGNAIIDSAGLLTATGATITGEIRGTSGYFGTLTNGFSISSTGLVGVGTGTIVGGTISGATFINGGGTFSVSSAGYLTASSGIVGGWTLSSVAFTNAASDTFLYANPGTDGLAYSTVGRGIMRRLQLNGSSGTTLGTNVLAVGGNTAVDGTITSIGSITTNSSLTVDSSATFGNTSGNPFLYLASSGTLRSLYTYGVARTTSTRTMIIDSSGNFGTTASTRRKKHEIESYKIDSNALLNLDVKTFKYKPEFDPNQQVQHGFIAEEAQALGLDELIQYDETGVPDYFAYEKLPIFLLQLVQELKAEIDQLKGV